MADSLDVPCPTCGKGLKVPAQFVGKRVKCKGCQEAFLVNPPGAKAAPEKKPAPVSESGSKPAPPAAADPSAHQRVTWDDAADDDSSPVGVIAEKDIPRCPHCAQELDPPDAIVCVNCGFNNRTRTKAETKKVYAPDASEWTMHLLPGVLCVMAIVTLMVLDVIVVISMREWMEGGLLESDSDLAADGRKKMLVSPGLFIMMCLFISLGIIVPLVKIGYKRLFVDYMPPEVIIK